MAVTTGSVFVQGTVNGVAAVSDIGRFVVNRRTTPFAIGIDTGQAASNELATCMGSDLFSLHFGLNNWPDRCAPKLPIYPDPDDTTQALGATLARVSSGGPNQGLWYVAGLSSRIWLRWQVNPDLHDLAPPHALWGGGAVGQKCGIPSDSMAYKTVAAVDSGCYNATGLTDMRRFIKRHEGCHSLLAVVSLDTVPNTSRLDSLEMLVRKDSSGTARDLRDLLGWINANALVRSKTIDSATNDTTFRIWLPTDSLWSQQPLSAAARLDYRC